MSVHYKATRPDGADFRTGTIRYDVGGTVEHPRTKRFSDMRPNDPSTYISVSVEPGEVLIGGLWPCRLFRVEPVGRTVKRTDGAYPNKRGCRALRVVEELPAHAALGPNGVHVAALIEQARTITYEQVEELRAAWDAGRGAAWDAGRGAAWDAGRGATWVAGRGAAWDAGRGATWVAGQGAAWDAGRGATWVAAWGAAVALLVRDLITAEQFDVLYGPWATVFGAPA